MSEHEREAALCALMDGELAPGDLDEVLEAVFSDPHLRATWGRYHAVGAAMRGDLDPRAGEIADRVRAALEREPEPGAALTPAPREVRVRVWHALALAASVAALAVLVTLEVSRQAPAPAPIAKVDVPPGGEPIRDTVASAAQGAASDDPLRLTRMTWNEPRPGVEQRLNGYLLNHSEYLSQGLQGLLPYARVVGYDRRD